MLNGLEETKHQTNLLVNSFRSFMLFSSKFQNHLQAFLVGQVKDRQKSMHIVLGITFAIIVRDSKKFEMDGQSILIDFGDKG